MKTVTSGVPARPVIKQRSVGLIINRGAGRGVLLDPDIMHACMHSCMHACMHVCSYVCVRVGVGVGVCAFACASAIT